MNYCDEVKNELIYNEAYKKVKDYSKNRSDLETYYNVGKLLIEVQGGDNRAKYGDRLIKEYSRKLTNDIGRGYMVSALKRMRKFYVILEKGATLSHQLLWSQYVEIGKLENIYEINYYINIAIKDNLSVRELRITKLKAEHIGQIRNIDKNIRRINQDKTIGIIICKRDNVFVHK